MKFEIFCLRDLSVKGEGNLHIIVLNERTGHVLIFKKDTNIKNEIANDGILKKTELNVHKMYKVGVNYKKYTVLQKFWGKVYLPKTRAGLIPAKIIEGIAEYIEEHRSDCRRHRSIIPHTTHIEIQPDLTMFPPECRDFIDGSTFCVELKPKFGILFKPQNTSVSNCLNKCSRFCLTQRTKEESKRTQYCPCDFFSGDGKRMKRSIKELIVNSQEKLRIFQDGHIIPNINEDVIIKFMSHLLSEPNNYKNDFVDQFCTLIIQAVTHDKSDSLDLIKLPFEVSTLCEAHTWSWLKDNDVADIYNGSVLGRLIHTDCLVNNTSEEMKLAYEKLEGFLIKNNIEKQENIFDLWNEHLITLEIPDDIRDVIRKLKKYVVSLTIRDCSLMIKFIKTTRERINTLKSCVDNSMVLEQPGGTLILATIDIIDISIKPLSKIGYNFQLEQQLTNLFNL